jgi:hypothetical protein
MDKASNAAQSAHESCQEVRHEFQTWHVDTDNNLRKLIWFILTKYMCQTPNNTPSI